ncbi:MAG: hypothetical protein HKN17_07275, partial [Rhodothermales bacterium]|nr:hypothetical protein [Rhodothermales bacterium]
MSRHLYAVGDTGRLGPEFLQTIRSSSALRSVTRVASVDGLREAIGEVSDADVMVLVCDEPTGGLVSLAERVPVVVCSTDAAGEDNLPGHPFIHWIPHLDDPQRCVRSLLSLVDQVWSARLKQFDLKDEAERAHRFFAVLANATTEGILVFRE